MWWEYDKKKLVDSQQILVSLSQKEKVIKIWDPNSDCNVELNILLFFPQLAHILRCLLTSPIVEVI